jgi:hypothetical protein
MPRPLLVGVLAIFETGVGLIGASAAERNLVSVLGIECSNRGCPTIIYVADKKYKKCSCKVCNNKECCIAEDTGVCKNDCSTQKWTVPKGEKCSDSNEADLCCKSPEE